MGLDPHESLAPFLGFPAEIGITFLRHGGAAARHVPI
jgi:hypothetical protein